LEVGDLGYADAVAGFDLAVEFAPDVVVDAQSPTDVASVVVGGRRATARVGAGSTWDQVLAATTPRPHRAG
jgi:hypothetical protein